MAISRGPKLVTNGLVLALDPSDDNSFAAQNLPIKNGLILWLDAADDDSFVYSSGTVVSQWRDKSGFNNHANQATVANQPNRNTAINSRKTITFDGTNDFFNGTSNLSLSNGCSVFTVIKSSATGERDIITSTSMAANTDLYLYQQQSSGKFGNWAEIYTTNAISTGTWYLLSVNIASDGSEALYLNGALQGSATRTLTNTRGYRIGANSSGGEFWNGEIAEIIIFNRGLSATEIKQVHNYLGQKWGILNTDRTIVDLSGNNNNGLLGNGTTADMPAFDAYNKGALKLDGTSDYIAVANATSLNPSTVTVSLWIKRNGYQSSVASYLRRNYNDAYAIIGDIAADNVRFRIHNGSTYPESPNATLSLNEWTNIVGTYDLNNIKIYKNGVFVNQTAHTSAISYSSANTVLTIGRDDPVAGRYMNANYGSVLIYNRALSAAEILQNYNAQKGKYLNTIVQQGLVLNLDAGNPYSYAGSGTTWYDVSGNAFNATLINSPTYTTDNGGVLNWASASSQYATVSMNSTLRVANITEEVWVYLSTTADQVFIGSQYGTGSNNSFALWVSGGTFYFGVNVGGTFYQSSSSAPSSGTWYHLVHTYNGTTQYLYINGVQTTSNGAASGNISYDLNNTLLAIAADFNGTGYNVGPTISVNGKMPVARIYNVALSAAQVSQNYNATKSRYGL